MKTEFKRAHKPWRTNRHKHSNFITLPFIRAGGCTFNVGKNMKNIQSSQCEEIWQLAGKALFACQFVEHNLTMLCGMLQTSVDVSPRSNPEIYGNLKERTASFQWLRKALAETGIVADHYLFPEIDEVFRRRDWLAHRVFLESTSSRQTTREFQIQGLEELSVMAYRLLRVLYAVAQHVAEKFGGVDPLPDEHVVGRLTAPYLEEAEAILRSMTSHQNGHVSDSES